MVGTQGARYAGTRAANLARSREEAADALERRHLEAAERMVATLGRMKGAAMKIGQLASFIDTEFLPPGVPRALPGAPGPAAHAGPHDALEAGAQGARRGVGGALRGAVREHRARRRRGGVDRPGPPRRAAGRSPGGGQDPVPGRGRGDRRGHAERRPDPAHGQGAGAGARREGGRRRAQGARHGGAGLRARGAEPALVRARLPRPPVHPRARRRHAAVHPARAGERVGRRRRLRGGQAAAAGRARPLRRDRLPLLLRLDLPPAALQRGRPPRATTC